MFVPNVYFFSKISILIEIKTLENWASNNLKFVLFLMKLIKFYNFLKEDLLTLWILSIWLKHY